MPPDTLANYLSLVSEQNNSCPTREACGQVSQTVIENENPPLEPGTKTSNNSALYQKLPKPEKTSLTSAFQKKDQLYPETHEHKAGRVVAVVNIGYNARSLFLKENQIDSCFASQPNGSYKLEKYFVDSDTVWKPALQLPFTLSVISKWVPDSYEVPVIVPIMLSSAVPHRCTKNESNLIDLYKFLSPLRNYAKSTSGNADVRLSPVTFIGLYDSNRNLEAERFFERRVKEAMSTAWADINILICRTQDIRTEVEQLLFSDNSLESKSSQVDCTAAKLYSKMISHIIEKSDQEEVVFITRSEIEQIVAKDPKPAEQVEEAVQYLTKRGFVHPVYFSNPFSRITSSGSYLISAGRLLENLEEKLFYSHEAKESLEKCGLVPFQVLQNSLGSRNDCQWLDIFCYFGIIICPEGIGHCSKSALLPRNLLIPYSLTDKKDTMQNPEGYMRTETLAIRTENGHCVTESQFYLLVGLLLQRYPRAPRCYYHAAKICIDSQHVIDVCLANGILHVSMLVKTEDVSFKSSKTAEKCNEVAKLLVNDGAAVLQEYGLLKGRLEMGALMKFYDSTLEFVKISNLPSETLTSDDGEEYVPPLSLYLWFGSYGPPETLIEKHFAVLAEDINFDKVWKYIVHRGTITKLQYEKVVGDKTSRRLLSSRLLSLLLKEKERGDQLLIEALKASNQHHLVRLMGEGSFDAGLLNSETSSNKVARDLEMIDQDSVNRQIVTHDTQLHSNEFLIQSNSQVQGRKNHEPPFTIASKDEKPNPCSEANADLTTSRTLPAGLGANEQGQTDPVVQPIYEARYYHAERATDYFNERPFREGGKRLGAGSYGVVYHGVLHSETGEKFEVAIKRFKKQSSLNPTHRELGRKQFRTEMNLLTRYTHENIVSLLGFSSDGPELCLIYEYMSNGALSHRLDCKDNTLPLPWNIRLSIAVDIACGLHFLHCAYRLSVIHRDVKSSNVLLNADFKAKLSDFGLAVVGNEEAEEVSYGPTVGTRPYMAPEAFEKVVTPKLDIYGLGMILFELATGLPPYSSKKKQDLKTYVNYIESQGIDLSKLLDPKAKWPKFEKSDRVSGLQLLDIAKDCTATDYVQRPAASEVASLVKHLANKSLSQYNLHE